jgi:hypothetical protein
LLKRREVALNQLINVAVAEKLSALRTDDYFRERSSRANISKAKRILKRAGRGGSRRAWYIHPFVAHALACRCRLEPAVLRCGT